MSKQAQQRFAPHGALALNPAAFGLLFDMPQASAPELTDNDVAVVTIRGPLMHHREWCFDSYEAIRDRVAAAIELQPRFVLLAIDSPGGLVSGAFDTARDLRKMATDAGVDLYAHVEGQATSAAYALATAAKWIGVSRSAALGSIGVIDTMVDVTAQNVALGINVQIIASGARKSDGNPNVAISDDALATSQARVDTLAGMFFDLVSDHGWGTTERLVALQAAIVTGEQAVQLGLATEVATLEQAIAFATPESMRSGVEAQQATEDQKGTQDMAMKATTEEDAVASLRKMAKSEDEDEAKKARAALKALGFDDDAEGDDDDDDDDAEGDDDDDDAEGDDDDDDAKSEGDDDDDDAKAAAKAEGDDDDDDAKAEASALVIATKALAKVHNLEARATKKAKRESRSAMLAKRPDVSPDMVAILSDPKMSDKQVAKILEGLDVGPTRADRTAALATATGTRGAHQGDVNAPRLPPAERAALDAQMGLTEMSTETVNTPNRLSFGVRVPAAQKVSK